MTRSFVFNGDNKQVEVKDVNGNTVGKYFYDGEGKRVKKVTDTETTIFVYSSGKLVAEYSTQLSQSPTVAYTTTDHLGSPRIITDTVGAVKSRRDFMPFGEDIFINIGNRTSSLNYSSSTDDIKQKFTGYQKDNETGLDFAEARMYENRFGRFTAVDPLLASGKSANPQTFNRYVYVGNNPVGITDPSGLDWFSRLINGQVRYQWSEDNKVFDDGSSIEGWEAVKFEGYFSTKFFYNGCADSGCTSARGAVLYKSGGWDWTDTFSYDMKNVLKDSWKDLKKEVANGFPGTRSDIEKIANDPLGEYGLGNPHLGMATGGVGSTFQGSARLGTNIIRFFRTADDVADAATTVTRIVQYEQYSLRAARDGMYPVMKRGFKAPVDSIFLKEGEVWKFGQTMNPTTRYSGNFLRSNNLDFVPEFTTPSFKDVLQAERQQILQYEQKFGKLPPGNKIRR